MWVTIKCICTHTLFTVLWNSQNFKKFYIAEKNYNIFLKHTAMTLEIYK